jgi:signal-transduction protein with cAMP-binding, CBS, and nucleotidyltransferase domain
MKWECYRCSYVFEGERTPDECPNCHYSLTFWLEHAETKPVTVRNFVKADPLSIGEDKSVLDAARAMKNAGAGNILVNVGGGQVGIVTERDIMNKVAAQDLQASKVKVKAVMTFPMVSVTADSPLSDAMRLMAKHRIRTLLVTEGGKPIGLLNMRSIVGDQFKVAHEQR